MKKILFSFAVLLAIVGCKDPNEGEMFVTPTDLESEMPVTDVLEKAPEYSLWIQMLKHANYYNALKDASATATVFAPTNEAVSKFLKQRKVNSVSELPVEYAKAVVQNHIIEGSPISETTIDNYAKDSASISSQNLFGTYLSLRYGDKVVDVDDAQRTEDIHIPDSIYINNQARLEKFTATVCANGNIFTMGDVILPLTETIVEKLEIDGSYTIFANAIRESKYDSIAALTADTTIAKNGSKIITQRAFTCFAVPDEVYAANGISDVNSLKAYLVSNSNGEETNGDDALTHYLQYHFLSREYLTSELFNFQSDDQTLIYDTKLSGQAIIANMVAGAKIINKSISILRSDIEASNGRINKIDEVMPVYHPAPVTVRWDFVNSADIISIVNAWGADKGYGQVFTSPLENSARTFDLSDNHFDGEYGTPTSFTYLANDTKAPFRNYRAVGFVKEKYAAASNKNVSQFGSYMNNYLSLNIGYAGWIQFTTPSVIAGKYKIVLHYCKDITLSSFFSSGTMTRFDLDGETSIVYLYKGLATRPSYEAVETTLWPSMTFDASTLHTFKITMMDIKAKTSASYHQMLDYVEFIPMD